tara:strand:- start:307 stop:1620 length:1314 start_codon:yes stop_codon:yes gene_type:complete
MKKKFIFVFLYFFLALFPTQLKANLRDQYYNDIKKEEELRQKCDKDQANFYEDEEFNTRSLTTVFSSSIWYCVDRETNEIYEFNEPNSYPQNSSVYFVGYLNNGIYYIENNVLVKYSSFFGEVIRKGIARGKTNKEIIRDLMNGANRAFISSNYDRAIKLYSELIKVQQSKKDIAQAYSFRATAKRYKEDYMGSINDINNALDLDPENPIYFTSRGLSRFYFKQYDKALKDYEQSIKLNPNDKDVYENRAYLYEVLGDSNKSCLDYGRAAELGCKRCKRLVRKGNCKIVIDKKNKERKNQESEAVWSRLILDANDLYKNKDFKQVLIKLDKAERIHDDFSKKQKKRLGVGILFSMRGISNYFLGNYSEAITDINKAIEIDKEWEERNNLFYLGHSKLMLARNNRDLLPSACENLNKAFKLGFKLQSEYLNPINEVCN